MRCDSERDLVVYRGLQGTKRDGAVASGREVEVEQRRLVGEVEVGAGERDDSGVAAVGLDVVGDVRQAQVDARHASGSDGVASNECHWTDRAPSSSMRSSSDSFTLRASRPPRRWPSEARRVSL